MRSFYILFKIQVSKSVKNKNVLKVFKKHFIRQYFQKYILKVQSEKSQKF